MIGRKYLLLVMCLAVAAFMAPTAFGAADVTDYGPELAESAGAFNPIAPVISTTGGWIAFHIEDDTAQGGANVFALLVGAGQSQVKFWTAGVDVDMDFADLAANGGQAVDSKGGGLAANDLWVRIKLPLTDPNGNTWEAVEFKLMWLDKAGANITRWVSKATLSGAVDWDTEANSIPRHSTYVKPTIQQVLMDDTTVNASGQYYVSADAKIWVDTDAGDFQFTDALEVASLLWKASDNVPANWDVAKFGAVTESVAKFGFNMGIGNNSDATDTQIQFVAKTNSITDYAGNYVTFGTFTPVELSFTYTNVYVTAANQLRLEFGTILAAPGANAHRRIAASFTDDDGTTRYLELAGAAVDASDGTNGRRLNVALTGNIWPSAATYEDGGSQVAANAQLDRDGNVYCLDAGNITATAAPLTVEVYLDADFIVDFVGAGGAPAGAAINDVFGQTHANMDETTSQDAKDAWQPAFVFRTADTNSDGTCEAVQAIAAEKLAVGAWTPWTGEAITPAAAGKWKITSVPANVEALLDLDDTPDTVVVAITGVATATTYATGDTLVFTLDPSSDWGTGAALTTAQLQALLNTGIHEAANPNQAPYKVSYVVTETAAATMDADGYDLTASAPTAGSLVVSDVDIAQTLPEDGASPVLLSITFLTGDNIAAGATSVVQLFAEQDDTNGDQVGNNRAIIKWSEEVQVTDSGDVSYGTDQFTNPMAQTPANGGVFADEHVQGNNAATVIDLNDEVNIAAGYGVDHADNETPEVTGQRMVDGTDPYVLLDSSDNLMCYLINPDDDGNYQDIFVKFNQAVAVTATLASVFDIDGTTTDVEDFAPASGDTSAFILTLPSAEPLTHSANLVLQYVKPDDDDNAVRSTVVVSDEYLYAQTGGAQINLIAGDDPNTNDIRIMDISGDITVGVDSAPPMTLVSGYVLRLRAVEGTMLFQGATIGLDSGDLSAINAYLESATRVYAHTCAGLTSAPGASGGVELSDSAVRYLGASSISEEDHVIGLTITTNKTTRVVSFTGSANVPAVGTFSISGSAKLDWVVGPRSQVAIDNDRGAYLLHVGDKAAVVGNPVLLQVTLPDGTEYMATNAVDGCGTGNVTGSGKIVFTPLNNPPTSSDDPKAVVYDIDTRLVQSYEANQDEWNMVPVLKGVAYYVGAESNLPTLPSGTTVKIQAGAVGDCFVGLLPPDPNTTPAQVVGTPVLGMQLIDDLIVISNRGLEFSDAVNSSATGVKHVVGGYGYVALLEPQQDTDVPANDVDPTLFFFGEDVSGTINLWHKASNLGWHTLANYPDYEWADMLSMFNYGIHYDVDTTGARSTNFDDEGDLLKLGAEADDDLEAYFLHTGDLLNAVTPVEFGK